LKVPGDDEFFSGLVFGGGDMVLWIGLDDTDSLGGMCTTFLATELVRDLTREFDLIGYPRLVRLNPNIPWKTRGNGALCLRIGMGRGSPQEVGWIDGRTIVRYPRSRGDPNEDVIVERVAGLVERWSRFEEETTNPAFVVLRKQPPPGSYWKAVRGVVAQSTVLESVKDLGQVRCYKNGRGVIGAAAAAAWRPRDRTYEILAYRSRELWGTRRRVDNGSVRSMDQRFPSTFNNYDYANDRVVIAPRTPCPILFGIRGDEPNDLRSAMESVAGESPERWLIFETNQGTDDHVVRTRVLHPWATVRREGRVTEPPRTIGGGHVVFRLDDLDVTAYEPSKQFRHVVRQLVVGDRVEVIGAVRNAPRTLNLEKLHVLRLAEVSRKLANPMCPRCRKRMKSMGHAAPYRCVRCGARQPRETEARGFVARGLSLGWHEPPVGSRRHLSKPLKRLVDRAASQRPSLEPARFPIPESDISLRRIGPLSRS
jgi:tRNA(Ile2)-agmatinylcytidine synthase